MSKFPKSIILLTDSTSLGGAELSLIEILKQLSEWRINSYLITTKKGELFDEFKKHTKEQLILPFPYPTKLASWIHYLSFKRRAFQFINAIPGNKVILVGDLYPLWAALHIRKQTNSPVYSIFQGEYVFENDSCPKKWIKYGANQANKLLASEPICTHINPLKLINKPVQCLNPKVNLSRFDHTLYNRNEIRHQLGFSSTDRLAICVGQIGIPKGQPWLAAQFLKNPNLYNNWHLLIVGPMRNKQDQVFFTQLKLQDKTNKLHLLGLRKDIPQLYAASDLALFAGTINESFGLAVVEAAVMELPVFALKSGSIPYNLGKGYTGLFPKNQKDLLINAWLSLTPENANSLKSEIDVAKLRNRLSQETWKSDLKKVFI